MANKVENGFEIYNVRTGLCMGAYMADSELEALEAYAKDAGYGSFEEACHESGTKPSDISVEMHSIF